MHVTPPRNELRRVLGPWDAIALVVGIIIGSGIFATPPLVARHLGATGPILGVWILGGVLALAGALCYAELASRFPRTGGAYVFLREAYGPFPAFCFGWSALLVTYPASVAAVSVVFTAYLARLIPLPDPARPVVAAGLCLAVAALNIAGVRLGAAAMRLLTGIKVLALAAVTVAALLAGDTAGGFTPVWNGGAGIGLAAAALSLSAVIWTYEGWADGPTLAGEMRDHRRDMVRALVGGTILVTGIYLVLNVAYLRVLGVDGVAASDSVAVDLAAAVFGPRGTGFVTALVLVSTLGAMNGMVVSASRVVFAMSRDGLFFRAAGEVWPRTGSPGTALVAVGVVSAVYAAVGSFESIVRYFVFTAGIWYLGNVASLFLHRRRGGPPAPFPVPGFPLTPLLFGGVTLALLLQLVRSDPRSCFTGLAILALALPVYRIRFRK